MSADLEAAFADAGRRCATIRAITDAIRDAVIDAHPTAMSIAARVLDLEEQAIEAFEAAFADDGQRSVVLSDAISYLVIDAGTRDLGLILDAHRHPDYPTPPQPAPSDSTDPTRFGLIRYRR